MRAMSRAAVVAGFLVTAALVVPTNAAAQRSGVEIWSTVCGQCHIAQPPNRYVAKDWESIGIHMIVTARLTSAQGRAVLDFLKQGALQVSMDAPDAPQQAAAHAPVSGASMVIHAMQVSQIAGKDVAGTYAAQCAPCHGAGGKGDGPAAVAFNPRPADFTDPGLFAGRSDAELVTIIAEGKGGMPPFGSLPSDMITALVQYVRGLSHTQAVPPGRKAVTTSR